VGGPLYNTLRYALIISTSRRNKEPKKKKDQGKKPRNKYNETKQNQGQKIIKHKKSQKEESPCRGDLQALLKQ